MEESVANFPEIFIQIDTEEELKKGAAQVVHLVRPDWKKDDFQYKIFTDGISNKLIGVYTDDKNKMLLVRVYGAKTELIIDRQSEIRNMLVLNQVGCGCQLYAKFGNGLVYQFLPGDILTIESAKNSKIFPKVAAAMAKMHKLVDLGPDVPKNPCMWKKLHMFLDQFPTNLQDPRLTFTKEKLTKEVKILEEKLACKKSPIVFTHNDLLLANIVISNEGQIFFIDYEYGDYNYQECDIANHFDEMAGVENMDFIKDYPSKQFQLEWIREYLLAYHEKAPTEKEIEAFHQGVNQFSLCYHMMWGLWGLVQAEISKIDFDFVAFGLSRLNEYFRVRDERL